MAIDLGGIALPDLVLSGDFRFGHSGVQSDLNVSRDGTPIIFEQAAGYKTADLLGASDAGWITHGVLLSLSDLAAVPNTTYTLVYEGFTYSVRFRNWDQPVIEANPLVPRPNPDNGDWYNNVQIKLLILI